MLLKAAKREFKFPANRELEATVAREIPFLARYLMDYVIPEKCTGTARYGVLSYHEKSLVRTAQHSSRTNEFREVLEDWKKDYFAEHKEDWVGTAHQLCVAFNKDAAKAAAIRHLKPSTIARQLASMKNKGYDITCSEGTDRVWTIRAPKKPGPSIPQATHFAK